MTLLTLCDNSHFKHLSIYPLPSSCWGNTQEGSSLSNKAQVSLYPANSSSTTGRTPRRSQAARASGGEESWAAALLPLACSSSSQSKSEGGAFVCVTEEETMKKITRRKKIKPWLYFNSVLIVCCKEPFIRSGSFVNITSLLLTLSLKESPAGLQRKLISTTCVCDPVLSLPTHSLWWQVRVGIYKNR